jgi:hypothetical protein
MVYASPLALLYMVTHVVVSIDGHFAHACAGRLHIFTSCIIAPLLRDGNQVTIITRFETSPELSAAAVF